jgi:hypothetical protein
MRTKSSIEFINEALKKNYFYSPSDTYHRIKMMINPTLELSFKRKETRMTNRWGFFETPFNLFIVITKK